MFKTKQLRWPFRDGAEKATMGYGPGTTFINVTSNRQPGVVSKYAGAGGRPLPITDSAEIYPGCKVRASLTPFAYEVQGNRGVSFLLGNVQKLGDGPRLDGRLRAEDEFAALEDAPVDFDAATDDPMAA
jgi:Enterobacter phage Enc34, ssDNA-binding protein